MDPEKIGNSNSICRTVYGQFRNGGRRYYQYNEDDFNFNFKQHGYTKTSKQKEAVN